MRNACLTISPDQNLQQEFNRWAEAGEGEKMRNHHLDSLENIRLMDLPSGERVLDLGCGSAWPRGCWRDW